ncbi:MAG: VanZ family protein [Chloroflexota bacterium]|nr:VanZ family protein [Chloroflexota bacterium]MBI5705112.1 VanZ family protein [Chloroflexota bacterium]
MFVEFNPLYGLVALIVILIVLRRKGKSLPWLFFFSLFGLYLIQVISLAIFPFPIDIPYENFKPNLNLIPFNFGHCDPRGIELCFRQIYENILLTVPFGFGVNFIARIKPRQIWRLAAGVGLTLEFIQLAISLTFRTSYRVVDINDVILNAAGVLIGYGVFRVFGWTYSQLLQRLSLQPRHIFAYVYIITHPPIH